MVFVVVKSTLMRERWELQQMKMEEQKRKGSSKGGLVPYLVQVYARFPTLGS